MLLCTDHQAQLQEGLLGSIRSQHSSLGSPDHNIDKTPKKQQKGLNPSITLWSHLQLQSWKHGVSWSAHRRASRWSHRQWSLVPHKKKPWQNIPRLASFLRCPECPTGRSFSIWIIVHLSLTCNKKMSGGFPSSTILGVEIHPLEETICKHLDLLRIPTWSWQRPEFLQLWHRSLSPPGFWHDIFDLDLKGPFQNNTDFSLTDRIYQHFKLSIQVLGLWDEVSQLQFASTKKHMILLWTKGGECHVLNCEREGWYPMSSKLSLVVSWERTTCSSIGRKKSKD